MSKSSFVFDKKKYLSVAESEGFSAALTQLHQDTNHWEHEAFEGEAGYQPEILKELHSVRAFSRELWERALVQSDPKNKKETQ